jgi:hypothetical protein
VRAALGQEPRGDKTIAAVIAGPATTTILLPDG